MQQPNSLPPTLTIVSGCPNFRTEGYDGPLSPINICFGFRGFFFHSVIALSTFCAPNFQLSHVKVFRETGTMPFGLLSTCAYLPSKTLVGKKVQQHGGTYYSTLPRRHRRLLSHLSVCVPDCSHAARIVKLSIEAHYAELFPRRRRRRVPSSLS